MVSLFDRQEEAHCYRCNGTGAYLIWPETHYGPTQMICDRCDGEGCVPEDQTTAEMLQDMLAWTSMSQKQLAKIVGVSPSSIGRAVRGEVEPTWLDGFTYPGSTLIGMRALAWACIQCSANGGVPDCFACWDKGTIVDFIGWRAFRKVCKCVAGEARLEAMARESQEIWRENNGD